MSIKPAGPIIVTTRDGCSAPNSLDRDLRSFLQALSVFQSRETDIMFAYRHKEDRLHQVYNASGLLTGPPASGSPRFLSSTLGLAKSASERKSKSPRGIRLSPAKSLTGTPG